MLKINNYKDRPFVVLCGLANNQNSMFGMVEWHPEIETPTIPLSDKTISDYIECNRENCPMFQTWQLLKAKNE